MKFEVIITSRPDFREDVVERCSGLEEARAVAERLARQPSEQVIRVWIRRSLGVKADCPNQ